MRMLVLLLIAVLLGACSELEEPMLGEEVGGLRIASLSPGVTATLMDRGHGSSLVARHGWDSLAAPSIPVAGDQNGLDYEKLLRTRPTHVFLQWGSREAPSRLMTLAREHGWVVEMFGSLTWEDIAEMEQRLVVLLGPAYGEDDTRPLRMVREPQPEAVREARAQLGPVLLMLAGNEPAALGPGSFHHTMLVDHLGALSAIPDGGAFVRLHAEDVVRLEPSAIVIIDPRGLDDEPRDPFDRERWSTLLGRIADLNIPAVQTGRVAILDHPLGLIAGTSLAEVEDDLASILDHWVGGID